MTALQCNAKEFNPNKLELVEVARYQRTIYAPLERVWENVLDWEHLPHLHASSFNYIELDDGGEWGWRTWSDAEHAGHVELCVATRSSYAAWLPVRPGNRCMPLTRSRHLLPARQRDPDTEW